MIIECSNCHARYQYGADRFEGKASKKIKCAKCGTVFEIRNPALESRAAVPDAAAEEHDSTSIARPKRVVVVEEGEAEDTGGRRPSSGLRLPTGRRVSLAIIDGNGAGSVFRFEQPYVTIGRSNADMVIDDTEASRNHAAVEVHENLFLLKDLDSTNGTFVEGEKIAQPVELQDKSEFRIGATTLMLIITEET